MREGWMAAATHPVKLEKSCLPTPPASNTVSVFGRLGDGETRASNAGSLRSRGEKLDSHMIFGSGLSHPASKQVAVRA